MVVTISPKKLLFVYSVKCTCNRVLRVNEKIFYCQSENHTTQCLVHVVSGALWRCDCKASASQTNGS